MKVTFTNTLTFSRCFSTILMPALTFWLLISQNAWAQTVYVTPEGSGQQTGVDWANALPGKQLQRQLTLAVEGSVFRLAGGLYKPNSTGDRTAAFLIPSGVQVYGGYTGSGSDPDARLTFNTPDQPSSTTLSGDIDNDNQLNSSNANNVVRFSKANQQTRLDGVVITGGYATAALSNPTLFDSSIGGGGVYNDAYFGDSRPLLQNCSFVANYTSGKGGAMFNDGRFGSANPTIINCRFIKNEASEGGGIYNNGNLGISSPTITNCQFINNTANNGGCLYNYSLGQQTRGAAYSSPILVNCSFISNVASSRGGVMYNNTEGSGSNTEARPILTNCSLSNNLAPSGGAFYNVATPFTTNSTNLLSGPTLYNSILWKNGGANAVVNVRFNNSSGGTSTGQGFARFISCLIESDVTISNPSDLPSQVITASPFVSEQSVQLSPCSPAVNAGNNSYYTDRSGPSTDLAGNPRIFPSTGSIDIGAYEYQGPANQLLSIVEQPTSQSTVTVGASVWVPVLLNSSATSYAWYQDGALLTNQTSATLTLTNVQPAQTGSYSLVATSACNSVTSTAFSLSVTSPVNDLQVSAVSNFSALCVGGNALLTAQISGGTAPYSYSWTSNAILSNQVNNTVQLNANNPGEILVSIQVTDANNLTAAGTLSLAANALPSVSITPSATAICEGQTATFTASPGLSYLWSNGQNTQNITVTVAGMYSVTATNDAGCSATAAIGLSINDQLNAAFTGLPASICQKANPVTLVPVTVGGSFAGPGVDGITFNPNAVAVGGPYSITYTIGTHGCVSTSVQVVTVLAAPTAPRLLTQNGQLYVGGQSKVEVPQYSGSVILSASGCQEGTLSWSGPDNSSGMGDISVSTNNVGTFVYSAVCQSNGCSSTPASATVVVKAAPLQVVAPSFDCATNKLTLRTTGGNGQPIEYHIPSVTQGWTSTNPIAIQAKNFKKEKLKLSARQLNRNSGEYEVVKLDYQLPACPSAREGAYPEPVAELQVRVLGNPVVGNQVVVEVQGAEGQRLQLEVNDISGRMISRKSIEHAGSVEQLTLNLEQCSAGLLPLRVSTISQTKTVKLIKQ